MEWVTERRTDEMPIAVEREIGWLKLSTGCEDDETLLARVRMKRTMIAELKRRLIERGYASNDSN